MENNHSERGGCHFSEIEDYLDLGAADYINIFQYIFEIGSAAYIISKE